MDSLSTTLVALSDPTRRAILERLARGEATVNELAAPFALTQQAVSKHLAYLERAKLLKKRREGRQHFCALDGRGLDEVSAWISRARAFWSESFDRLEALALELHEQETKSGRRG